MRHKFMHVFGKFIACVMRILMWQTTSLCLKLETGNWIFHFPSRLISPLFSPSV